jgi:hypothetical protein
MGRQKRLSALGFLMIGSIAALFLYSCSMGRGEVRNIRLHKNMSVWKSPETDKAPIQRVVILPFATHALKPVHTGPEAICSFCSMPFHEHRDFSAAGERLAEYLYNDMEQSAPFEMVPLGDVFGTFSLQNEKEDSLTSIPFLQTFGAKFGADAVVAGEVLRIRERQGTNYSVVAPASVAFRLKVIRVRDGVELYRISFDETQKPLSEEPERLFRWSRVRLRWQTADQLARAGVGEVAAVFADR